MWRHNMQTTIFWTMPDFSYPNDVCLCCLHANFLSASMPKTAKHRPNDCKECDLRQRNKWCIIIWNDRCFSIVIRYTVYRHITQPRHWVLSFNILWILRRHLTSSHRYHWCSVDENSDVLNGFNHPLQSSTVLGRAQTMPIGNVFSQYAF